MKRKGVPNMMTHAGADYGAEAKRRDRLCRLGILEEPMGYVDGLNLYEYVKSGPTSRLDPLGLKTWYGDMGCENDCSGVLESLVGGIPALPDGGRLDKARQQSGLDYLTMIAQAYKESTFNPNAAAPNSTAVGLWQTLEPTAQDIQNRVWPNFVSKDNWPVPAGANFADYRTDPFTSASMYYVYLLDRIAAGGGDLQKGLENYFGGKGKEDYAKKVLAGRNAIRKVCGFGPNEKPTLEQLRQCAKGKCKEIKQALEATVR
jgi:hypothetical protein